MWSLLLGLALPLAANAQDGDDDNSSPKARYPFAHRHLALEVGAQVATKGFSSGWQASPLATAQLHTSLDAPGGVWLEVASAPSIHLTTGRCGGFDCVLTSGPAPLRLMPGVGLRATIGPIDLGAAVRYAVGLPVYQVVGQMSWTPRAVGVVVEGGTYYNGLRDQHALSLLLRWRPSARRPPPNLHADDV